MKRTIAGFRSAQRLLALFVSGTILAACSGGGTPLVPTSPGTALVRSHGASADDAQTSAARPKIAARVRLRIPRRTHAHALRGEHPSTISPLTQSVTIAVDGGAAQLFDATPSSPGCGISAGSTICTFTVKAPLGTDSFAVTTYSAQGATGTPLDHGVAAVALAKGTANAVAVTLGPVVSTNADTGVGSLRYAIGSANAGDTIMFLLPAASIITLASPITIFGSVSLAGPGVSASGVTISGGNANQLFLVSTGATLAISGLTLTQGKAATASTPGGAILNGGTLTLTGDTIGNSTSVVSVVRAPHRHRIANLRLHPDCTDTYAQGGAIYNEGSLTMSGNTFNGNFVESSQSGCIIGQGGAIYNDTYGALTSTGDTFSGNSTEEGGAVYNVGIGSVSFTNDTFTGNTGCTATSGCMTSGCGATSCTSFAAGEGAAIFDDGSGVTIVSSTFKDNVAGGASNGSQGFGGALLLMSELPSVTNSTFTGNMAGGGSASCSQGEGGAIAATTPMTLTGDTFTSNSAIGDAGAIGGAVFDSQALTGSNLAFTSNEVLATGSACTTSATAIAGAAYAADLLTLTGSTFTGNSATGGAEAGGGAVGAAAGVYSGDTFTSNSATATGTGNPTSTEAFGGAIYSGTLSKIGGSTFTSNSIAIAGATAQEAVGGAIGGEGSLISSGDTFISNSATATGGNGGVEGGAVGSVSGSVASNADTFKQNSATATNIAAAGALSFESNSTVSGDLFTGNTANAPMSLGGALAGSSAVLTSDTFTSNVSGGSGDLGAGGAIYDAGGMQINGSTISQNQATTEGGGLSSSAGDSISDSIVTHNAVTTAATTDSGGGGLFLVNGSDIYSSTIAFNSVAVGGVGNAGGGGIYSYGGSLALSLSSVYGNAVTGSAGTSGGGGIYLASNATMTDSTITGNASSLDGGGIEIAANHTVTATNVTIYQNAATAKGGNINNLFAMTLGNSIVAGGTAATGPDIDNTGTLTSADYNLIQNAVAGTALAGTVTHDITNTDPLLLPLADNGGQTLTNAEQAASPGVNHIPFTGSNCGGSTVPIDQREYTRGGNGHCDIGAFEYYGAVPSSIRKHAPHVVRGAKPMHTLMPVLHPHAFPKVRLGLL